MAEILIFDTTFLIDFQRERRREDEDGPAHRFLLGRPQARMQLPVTALGEFAEGFTDRDDPLLQAIARLFEALPCDSETAYRYAETTRLLRKQGRLIGANDLWIAACALRHGRTLLTRNTHQFGRVPGLRLLTY